MKHTALIICLFLTTNIFSQNVEQNINKRKIVVTGLTEMVLEPSVYLIEINLRERLEYQRGNQDIPGVLVSLDSLERTLKKILNDNGFDAKKLVEIYVGSYTNNGNGREYNLVTGNYEFKLINYSEMRKFIKNIKFEGMSGIRVRRLFDIDKEATEVKLFADALSNAKSKAEKLLATTNNSLGDILSINLNGYTPIVIDDPYNANGNWGYSGQQEVMGKKTISASLIVTYEIK